VRRVGAVALVLLGAVGCASPSPTRSYTVAGAWVLWVGVASGSWAPHSAYDSAADCESQAQALTARETEKRRATEKNLASPYPGARDLATVMSQMGDRMAPRFVCLPDTIDPRAPKPN
jgi:hypothetical protein